MSALAVCNNVTPVDKGPIAAGIERNEEVPIRDLARRSSFIGLQGRSPSRGNSIVDNLNTALDEEPQLEASSPDEVALVKFGY